MYKKILVPLDGSELAEKVLPFAREIASRLGADIVFLHAYSPQESEPRDFYKSYIQEKVELLQKDLRETAGKSKSRRQSGPAKVEGEIVNGHPAEEILHYAEEKKVDLILMATHGRSGISRWAIGSAADKVLRSSAVPVLLIRANASEKITAGKNLMREILVPLDGSKLAESVIPHVEAMVKQDNSNPADVILLYVCEPMLSSHLSMALYMELPINWKKVSEEYISNSRKTAAQYLEGIASRLTQAGLRVKSEVAEGIPADKIINYSEGNPSTIIVMATHGRSGVRRWAFGSVADKVLTGSSNPVLLIRPHAE